VDSVGTGSSVPWFLAHGAEAYASFGVGKSRGTLPIQLAGNIRRGGLVERAFGLSLRELLYDYGGGSATGKPIRAVQVGGPLGAYVPSSQFDTLVDYEALAGIGAMLGHGGLVAVPDGTCGMRAAARAGVKVPKLCATDTLKAFGSCRLCLVEIEGRKGYPASCTTTVAAGMKIRTRSDKLLQLRRGVIDLYVSDHPLECASCPAQGHCELEDMAAAVGITGSSYTGGAM